MITKYSMGQPYSTEAVVKDIPTVGWESFPFAHKTENEQFIFSFTMAGDDIIYGLGEASRGINKRGWIYQSYCTDEPTHLETKESLYAAHNFLIFRNHGIFIDFPARIRWDIGFTRSDTTTITVEGTDFDIYVIEGDKPIDIVRAFRKIIGQSYIPPFWAFGYQQSRWSYPDEAAVNRVVDGYDHAGIPLDCVYLDLDLMERYKDFTVSSERFPNFQSFVADKRAHGIHLIPIIDAAIKQEDGYDVYEEGKANGYFCKNADGTDFEGGVWPGNSCFPDFMRRDVREWFGTQYKKLTDLGIDGFWNDMNEPALFYSVSSLQNALNYAADLRGQNLELESYFRLKDTFYKLSNSPDDYASIYHNIDGRLINHQRLHNIYGANMTKAASEYFEKEFGKEKILIFSRSSYIGSHRTSGIWFGDNSSWWAHILLCLKMLPSANMCGFLYCGADIGGFGDNVTRDLLLRFLALGVFTPLMRNHSCLNTRDQECFSFENPEDFRDVVQVRYRLIPYLYKTFRKASEENDMIFRPLSFDYPEDTIARECETQLMLGDECMIAPVYEQNAGGRYVYLPEDMTFVKLSGENVSKQPLSKGIHYVDIALNEVPLFIKKGKTIPLCKPAMRTSLLDTETLEEI